MAIQLDHSQLNIVTCAQVLNLKPRTTYIYIVWVLMVCTFLSHFLFFLEARNKFPWFYTEFLSKAGEVAN